MTTTDNLLTPENEAKGAKPANLPEKFWDAKGQAIRLDALVASYCDLERKLSTMIPAPASDEDRQRVYQALGVPAAAEDYQVDVSHGLFTVDPALNQRFLEKGFTPEQVQTVYDMAAEKMVPMIMELAEDFRADREVERLIAAFGGPDSWGEISRQLLAYGRKNLPPDVLGNLAGSFEGVMALYRMMKGQEPALGREGTQKPDLDENGLRTMMRDPRYWKDRDPSFVAQVTESFEKMYGGE